jgi:hypothetical protein
LAPQVHRRRADETGHEHGGKLFVEGARRVDLLQARVLEHGNAMAHRHRLHLVMGHIDGRGPEPCLETRDVRPRLDPQLGVEI